MSMESRQIILQNKQIEDEGKLIAELQALNEKYKAVYDFFYNSPLLKIKIFQFRLVRKIKFLAKKFLSKRNKENAPIPYEWDENLTLFTRDKSEEKEFDFSVAVQIKLENPALLDDFLLESNMIPCRWDLYISTELEEEKIRKILQEKSAARNIYVGKLAEESLFLPELIQKRQNYAFVCNFDLLESLSDKKMAENWRKFDYKHLFGNPENISAIFEYLPKNDGKLMVQAEKYPVLKNSPEEFPQEKSFWIKSSAVNGAESLLPEASCKIFNNCQKIPKLADKKRIVFFVHYDKNDKITESDFDYLKAFFDLGCKIFFVTNSKLSEEDSKKISPLCFYIMRRANYGYDFGAWKDSLTVFGFDELKEFDEVILANNSCYAPIFPLNFAFSAMENSGKDFWGMTIYDEIERIENEKKEFISEHIESFFVVFNKNVISDELFAEFWNSVEYFNSAAVVIRMYEVKMTEFFSKKFSYACYMDMLQNVGQYIKKDANYLMWAPDIPLMLGCPLCKKKIKLTSQDEYSKLKKLFGKFSSKKYYSEQF